MGKTVDSKKQMLEGPELLQLAAENMRYHEGRNVRPDLMVPAIISELSAPGVEVARFGNTVFEVIPGKNSAAYFVAFNADTPMNFLENSRQFISYAKEDLGLKALVTQFKDPSLLHLFKAISYNPPYPGMGYAVQKSKSGNLRVTLNLGR